MDNYKSEGSGGGRHEGELITTGQVTEGPLLLGLKRVRGGEQLGEAGDKAVCRGPPVGAVWAVGERQ